jgi:RNA polymerase sigma-70 factor (ECF subfamily)
VSPVPTYERDSTNGPGASGALDSQAIASDVAKAQKGDVDAFERLYRSHVGRVTALCLRLTGDGAAAEELMQDVFVRAWERLPAFRGESALSTWLHRVTVNTFLHQARSTRRRGAHEETTDDLGALPVATISSDPGDRMDLERAIARLPEGARTAFVLHDIEGYKHDEIAALSGIAPATVRAQLHRARRLLMEALNR